VSRRRPSALIQALAATVLVVGLVIGYVWFTTGDIANIMAVIGLSDSGSQVALQTPGPRPKPKKPATDAINTAEVANQANASTPVAPIKSDAPSIWGFVKNDLGDELTKAGPALTADQEATFKAGLEHEFYYQRYKTVLDLAAAHAPGSEEMLRTALESNKFWTRMRAIIALADMGEELSDDDIKQALGRTHHELRTNFFKRFEKSTCTVGCYFVARASLPHLDAAGRAQVIRVISKEASDIRDTYMVAATKDQSPAVRKEAEAWLAENEVDQVVYDDIERIIENGDDKRSSVSVEIPRNKEQSAETSIPETDHSAISSQNLETKLSETPPSGPSNGKPEVGETKEQQSNPASSSRPMEGIETQFKKFNFKK
jgi:hypothetical protein